MAEPHEVVQAIMPAGSTVYWAGGTYHGAGANRSASSWRDSIFASYALGWLRTEESQVFCVSMDVAATLDPKLLALLPFYPEGSLGFHNQVGIFHKKVKAAQKAML